MMFKVLKRKVTIPEAEVLIKQIKMTPYIMGYCLKEWVEAEHIIVAENENCSLMGACLNYDFSQDWNKIAALFVLEEFRGQGIGRYLFYESVKDAIERNKNVYTISSNPIIIKMMKELGFVTFESLFKFPEKYQNEQLVFYLHSISWLLNLYRTKEIIRKKIVYNSQEPFLC
ncbi:GNAT family N-acetyltransferase, partial [Nostoc sp. CHAB 5715]|uniref:GNAT family N-acetyltransferase n=1 Tax=Nostoc sp. CHAB 5715 TaxID=2780400 RepID=UPI001E5136CA